MNIISCPGFVSNTISDVIFSCHSKLVHYYISKGFVLHENNSIALRNVPLSMKQRISV